MEDEPAGGAAISWAGHATTRWCVIYPLPPPPEDAEPHLRPTQLRAPTPSGASSSPACRASSNPFPCIRSETD